MEDSLTANTHALPLQEYHLQTGHDAGSSTASSSSRPQRQASLPDSKTPLVFLHGVGFGVFPYLGFVRKLMLAFQGRPFILLEMRHISLRLCISSHGVEDVVHSLAEVRAPLHLCRV